MKSIRYDAEKRIELLRAYLAFTGMTIDRLAKKAIIPVSTLNFMLAGDIIGSIYDWEQLENTTGFIFLRTDKKIETAKYENGIEAYMILALKLHGNTILGRERLSRWGVSTIINELSNYGFKCQVCSYSDDGGAILALVERA